MRKYLPLLFIFLAVVLLLQQTTGPKVGTEAPTISAFTLAGEAVNSSQFEGKTVVLDFWATWCAACVSSLPALHRFYETYRNDPSVMVLAVHVPKGAIAPAVQNFCDKRAYRFPVILDKNAELSARFQIQSIPTLVVIGPDGNVRHVKNGALGGSAEDGAARIESWVEKAAKTDHS